MPTPIETMLNAVEWEVLPPDNAAERETKFQETGIPYATHTGKFMIGDIELDCARLNTGQAVITKESFERFFGWLEDEV